MRKILFIVCLLSLLSVPLSISSHPGRTDKYGGHTEKATGKYHIHNEDGTLTYTTKPTENTNPQQSQPTVSTEQTQQLTQSSTSQPVVAAPVTVSPSVEQTAPTPVPTTAEPLPSEQVVQSQQPAPNTSDSQPVVGVAETNATSAVTTKPLQQEVTENIAAQENAATTRTVYKYKIENTSGITLNLFWIIILGFFAFIGICMVSAVVHLSLQKIEGKSQNIDFFLYIPFVIVIIPAYIGDLLFKAYIKLSEKTPPKPKQQSKKKDNFI